MNVRGDQEPHRRDSAQTRSLIIGPGWLGSAIADAAAARGDDVWTIRRGLAHTANRAGSVAIDRQLQADITDDADSWGPALRALPQAVDHVVLSVAPARARGDTHPATYPAAARGAVRLASLLHARTLTYTSSTGVYAASDGAIVHEGTPLLASDARTRALVDAERAILEDERDEAALARRTVLRVAGLYGPGRDPAARFRGAALDDDHGARWCNFAWRDDVVAAVLCLQSAAVPREEPSVFNCADGSPVRARDITSWLQYSVSNARRIMSPTTTAEAQAGQQMNASEQTQAAVQPVTRSNQRVSVDKLRATGWTPLVQDVFEGFALLGHPRPAS